MNGGVYEYTASWDSAAADSSNYISSYGSSFATSGGASTKYTTAYSNGTSTYNGTKIYEVGKVGDATKETYLGSGDYGWFSDYAIFACSSGPFFSRGGYYFGSTSTGVFYSNSHSGNSYSSVGFRAALVP